MPAQSGLARATEDNPVLWFFFSLVTVAAMAILMAHTPSRGPWAWVALPIGYALVTMSFMLLVTALHCLAALWRALCRHIVRTGSAP